MTTEELKKRKPLQDVASKDQFAHKAGMVYLHNGTRYDLRTISEATAEALANDPKCMFLAWKDETKRPEGQRGVYAPNAPPSTPAPAAPTADAANAASAAGTDAADEKSKKKS